MHPAALAARRAAVLRAGARLALRAALVLPALLPLAREAAAQSQATTGVIRGTVTDSAGSPLAAATVTLRNVETNFARTIAAGDRGTFVATLLPLGTYEAQARAVGYAPVTRGNIVLRLGQTVEVPFVLARRVVELTAVQVTGQAPTVDVTRSEAAAQLADEVIAALPNNGRNILNLTLLTPSVAVTQGPDGDVLSVGGQRGIHNNVSVDGADFNNPFFGEQRGGQRPPFTFNLDAVQELVVVSQGANAEFGRSGGGFVNVITKSGTNQLRGTAHYFGKDDALSSRASHGAITLEPDFRQQQFGFTLGGPIVRDRAFFFVAYDQQLYDETKQLDRPESAALDSLRTFLGGAFGGALRNDFEPIARTADANVLLAKVDWQLGERNNASLKYNFTNSRQENGTFDVDTWGRSANAVERDFSHAVNGSLFSQLTNTVANEFRFQLAREDRPREYEGPELPGTGRPFPDTGMDFANGFRVGLPFFIPVDAYDTRVQVLDNVSWASGDHLFKVGGEWNRTEANQTFVGFANGRFIFNSVTGFINYVQQGSGYVECANGTTRNDGQCPGSTITGPVELYLQFAGVGGRTPAEAGTQKIPQHEFALFAQDTWKPTPRLTLNYGLRWEAQLQPDPITPPDEVFFRELIGQTATTAQGSFTFPSDGEIPSDLSMFQPRFGVAWDVNGDGRQVVRGSAGQYFARVPGLNLASSRSTNGSIGQTIFRNSALIPVLGPPPAYDELLPSPSGDPFRPDVFVFDRDFRNPRTRSASLGYERELPGAVAASVSYTYAATDFLTRFVDRNAAVFGNPFSTGVGEGGANGVGVLTTVESTAKSRYSGVTLGLRRTANPNLQFDVNYTLSSDKSDDDNERDPFVFRYARADRLDREYGYSDRDQRHRFNLWLLAKLPLAVYMNNRFSAASAQPTSEKCGANNQGTGERAASPSERICLDAAGTPTGVILQRNTIRRDNAFASWDVRFSRAFPVAGRGQVEGIIEVFNVLNRDNFRDPSANSLLFNFDGTIRSGLGDPRQVQAGVRYSF